MIFISLLKDKCFQIFIENKQNLIIQEEGISIETAKQEIANIDQSCVTTDMFLKAIYKVMFKFTKDLTVFAKLLPGLDAMEEEDLAKVLKDQIYFFYMIKNSKYFDDEECFAILDNNIHCCRKWFDMFRNEKSTSLQFKFINQLKKLNLNDNELSVFLPFLLCSAGKILTRK